MHYTQSYVENLIKELERTRKELNDLKEYMSNPCVYCGPDGWSTYMCDKCVSAMEENAEAPSLDRKISNLWD